MPFVVTYHTGDGVKHYLTSSQAQGVDTTDLRFARVYVKQHTAKGVATQFQEREMEWFENEQYFILNDITPYPGWKPKYNGTAPCWSFEEI